MDVNEVIVSTSSGVNAAEGSGGPMASAEREPITGVWGGAPSGV